MTDKELHKLSRREMLQLMLAQGREAEKAKQELADTLEKMHQLEESYERLKRRLDDKDAQIHKLRAALQTVQGNPEIQGASAQGGLPVPDDYYAPPQAASAPQPAMAAQPTVVPQQTGPPPEPVLPVQQAPVPAQQSAPVQQPFSMQEAPMPVQSAPVQQPAPAQSAMVRQPAPIIQSAPVQRPAPAPQPAPVRQPGPAEGVYAADARPEGTPAQRHTRREQEYYDYLFGPVTNQGRQTKERPRYQPPPTRPAPPPQPAPAEQRTQQQWTEPQHYAARPPAREHYDPVQQYRQPEPPAYHYDKEPQGAHFAPEPRYPQQAQDEFIPTPEREPERVQMLNVVEIVNGLPVSQSRMLRRST